MQPQIDEIAQDVFRLSVFVPQINMQFNHFLIRDEQPVLVHAGLRSTFPLLKEAVAKVLPPSKLRWIAFSHFEADECGSLNDWLALAPGAAPLCSLVGALVSVNDVALRPAKPMADGETIDLGAKKLRFLSTPHVPHSWDAGLFFEETARTLFTSDLFHQNGELPALTDRSVLDGVRASLLAGEQGAFAHSVPYTKRTEGHLMKLAELQPRTLATMHGSSFRGDGAKQIRELAGAWKELLG